MTVQVLVSLIAAEVVEAAFRVPVSREGAWALAFVGDLLLAVFAILMFRKGERQLALVGVAFIVVPWIIIGVVMMFGVPIRW